MVYVSLLSIAVLAVASGAIPLYCSDVQSPASGNGHNTDLSQVTTLQYCVIDNCTIKRIDTGQQLDIIYTTESLLIVTPKDGHTSMVIAKVDDGPPCHEDRNNNNHAPLDLAGVILGLSALLIMIIDGSILMAHIIFKELRSFFGMLLIFYSLSTVLTSGNIIALSLMNTQIAVNSQIICHTALVMFMLVATWIDISVTNLLTYLAYIMYRCYHLKNKISTKHSRFLFRCYMAYTIFMLVLLFFLVVAYDWRTGNAENTLLMNGHCSFIDQYSTYNTLYFGDAFVFINKFIQITMFLVYLAYFYKFNKHVNAAQVSLEYNRKLVKIAIVMGTTIGLSYFMWIIVLFNSRFSDVFSISSAILLVIQKGVIMVSLVSSKTVSKHFKACFSRDED